MTTETPTNRSSARQPVLLDARCRQSSWIVNPVELVNISEGGCCILGRIDGIAIGDKVSLRIATFGSIAGKVKWIKKREAGLEFTSELDKKAVEALTATYSIGEARQAGFRGNLNAA